MLFLSIECSDILLPVASVYNVIQVVMNVSNIECIFIHFFIHNFLVACYATLQATFWSVSPSICPYVTKSFENVENVLKTF